ncbi:MAG: hypothetical protein Q9M18_05535, partial [Mariprofundaceae bacterium]|nr:hypothetical protein [Mariprofundaceae bacterium]
LITRPETLPQAAVDLLSQSIEFPIAAWILARLNPKTKKKANLDTPWLKDERVLQAFRVFEEDVAIEQRRRKAEVVWIDRHEAVAGKGRGKEVEQALNQAWEAGTLIYFQGAEASLHSGSSLSAQQACLRIDCATYLYDIGNISNNFEHLIKDKLTAKIFHQLQQSKNIFMDYINGTGCLLRGDVVELLHEGYAIYRLMHELYIESDNEDDKTNAIQTSKINKSIPSPSICMTMQGDWNVVNGAHPAWGEFRIASSAAMAQASAGLAHDENIARLIAWKNKKTNKLSLGGIHIEGVDIGGGNMLPILHNQGFAVSNTVMHAYADEMTQSAQVKELSLDREQASAVFSKYRITGNTFDITTVMYEDEILVFTKVGVTRLNGRTTEMYELLQPTSDAANLIRSEMLMSWAGL